MVATNNALLMGLLVSPMINAFVLQTVVEGSIPDMVSKGYVRRTHLCSKR